MAEHMKYGQTFVMIDNTTFASAGRAMYHGDKNTYGGTHAKDYYTRYPDAISLDRQSLAEFLTALILFDVLVWDGSSHVQELKDMDDAAVERGWVYNWFPQFKYAYENGIIDHILKNDTREQIEGALNRLERAQLLSLQWVKEHFDDEYKSKLPRGFRVPLAYQSEDYRDRSSFIALNQGERFGLNEEQLAVAMFLHRGLFYQSRICSEDGWSYLPHSYRAYFLSIPEVIGLSIMCDDESFFYLQEPITGTEILRNIDEHFQRELGKVIKMKPTPVGTAIGASFMQMHRQPYRAFCEALSFRESRQGENVREQFRGLVDLGISSNRQGIENRIREIDKSLRNEARNRFGTAWSPDPNATYAINLVGSWKSIIEPLIDYLPMNFREGATKFLYKQINRNGFQILFSNYL